MLHQYGSTCKPCKNVTTNTKKNNRQSIEQYSRPADGENQHIIDTQWNALAQKKNPKKQKNNNHMSSMMIWRKKMEKWVHSSEWIRDVLTCEAGWGRVGLDVRLSIALNHIPEAPNISGMEDVEGLVGMQLAVFHVWAKQVVVWTGVPLTKKGVGCFRSKGTHSNAVQKSTIMNVWRIFSTAVMLIY